MRKVDIYGIIFVFLLLAISPNILAGDKIACTITDSANNIVKLTDVSTKQISFQLNGSVISIPVIQISEVKSLGHNDLLKVALLSGQTHEVTSSDKIEGEWELGSYSIEIKKVNSIIFEKPDPPPPFKPPAGFVAEFNGITIYSLEHKMVSPNRDSLWMPFLKGPVVYSIPFAKIKQILQNEIVLTNDMKLKGLFHLKNSNYDSIMFDGRPRNLVGKTAIGTIELPAENVKSITFKHDKDIDISFAIKEHDYYDRNFAPSDSKIKGTITVNSCEPVNIEKFISGEVPANSNESISVEHLDAFDTSYGSKNQFIEVYIGEGLNKVELSKVIAIKDFEVRRDQTGFPQEIIAKITTKAGNVFSVKFKNLWICFGGTLDIGYAKVPAVYTKSIELKSD